MNTAELLADRFEGQRSHLRAVAYRMLGSLSEADDAVQEAWLRLSRSDADRVENLGAWLTTVVARVCLNMLRARKSRREESLDLHLPDPIVSRFGADDPEQQALVGDSVGLALLVVLESLAPAERVAFVLHDVFGVPFEDIAEILERSPMAVRQLASRARRRVHGVPVEPDADLSGQRVVVEAFLAAARNGDFEGLVAVLDPDVVLRADGGRSRDLTRVIRGATAVAQGAMLYSRYARAMPAEILLVNGALGVLSLSPEGEPLSLMAFTIVNGKIAAMHALADPERLARLGVADS